MRLGRFVALGSLIVVVAAVAVIVLNASSHSGSHSSTVSTHHSTGTTSAARAQPGTATVPILIYHVINVPPSGSSGPSSLYVPADEFSSQMQALKAAGWHAVTLDQLEAYWTRGGSLGSGKPIVITFDTGYASQYTNALPVLKQLGWVGVENLQVNGLSPSDGGLTDPQVRGLIAAGWELGSSGVSGVNLISLDAGHLQSEVATSRQLLRSRYGVPVNWFSYPLGQYDSAVIAAVRSAGYVGATTTVPGWASPQQDRFRLPRLQVRRRDHFDPTPVSDRRGESAPAPPTESGTGTP